MAVVGYGYWGSKHVRVLSKIPGVTVTIVDADAKRRHVASIQFPTARLSTTLDHVLDDVDAAIIATPPTSHVAAALPALAAGKHLLIEKPLATSVDDAELLVATAARAGAVLMVGHTFEYNPAVWKVKEIIDSGVIGRVLYIDMQRLSLGRYQSDCDVIWDLATHDISIASYFLDELPSSAAVWAQRNIGVHHADVAYLRLDFARCGTYAFVHVSWLHPHKVRRVTVVGEQKMVVYDDMSDNERVRIYDVGVDPSDIDNAAAAHGMPVSYRTGDIVSPYVSFEEPLLIQDRHFIDCVRTDRRPNTPGERGLDVVRVLAATHTPSSVGGPVRIEYGTKPAEVQYTAPPPASPSIRSDQIEVAL